MPIDRTCNAHDATVFTNSHFCSLYRDDNIISNTWHVFKSFFFLAHN